MNYTDRVTLRHNAVAFAVEIHKSGGGFGNTAEVVAAAAAIEAYLVGTADDTPKDEARLRAEIDAATALSAVGPW